MVQAKIARVRPASNAEAGRIVSMMTLGFADDPVCRRLYPDPEQYLTFFPEFVRLYGGTAFDHGSAHVIDGMGAALWIAPNAHPDGAAIDDLIERSVDAAARPEIFEVSAAMSRGHPQEPLWFLPLISVDPFVRGSGLGSALIEYGLAACDRDGVPAYLDSTHPRNIPFYERFGFEMVRTIKIGEHPAVYPMLRRPSAPVQSGS